MAPIYFQLCETINSELNKLIKHEGWTERNWTRHNLIIVMSVTPMGSHRRRYAKHGEWQAPWHLLDHGGDIRRTFHPGRRGFRVKVAGSFPGKWNGLFSSRPELGKPKKIPQAKQWNQTKSQVSTNEWLVWEAAVVQSVWREREVTYTSLHS